MSKDPYTFTNASSIPPSINAMMHKYYSNLDGPTHPNSLWLDALTEDVEFTLGASPTLHGREGPEAVRASISQPAGPVVRMKHRADTAFVVPGHEGKGEMEIMMTGGVTYYLVDGRTIDCGLATYAVVVMGEEARMKIYRGFIDLGELRQAIQDFNEGKMGTAS